MSFRPSVESKQIALDSIPAEDHAFVAERMSIPVAGLLEVAFEACGFYDDVILRERGEFMTPEEAEDFVEHIMCEYT